MVILLNELDKTKNVEEIIFATKQQAIVAKLLIDKMKDNGGGFDKTEMSIFATKLHDGKITMETRCHNFVVNNINISYNKRQFYERILAPMKDMGLVEYNEQKKMYFLSDKFSELMSRLGEMWNDEIKKTMTDINTIKRKVASKNALGITHCNRFPQPVFSN